MKDLRTLAFVLVTLALILAACEPAATPTAAPTEEPGVAVTEAPLDEPAAGLVCAEPVRVGLITDASGSLAVYGAHILRSFMLGMEYASGAPGSAGEKFDFTQAQENTFKVDECEIQVFARDDGSKGWTFWWAPFHRAPPPPCSRSPSKARCR
jgi:branched-chain amino acid transport system substrate-binding protein